MTLLIIPWLMIAPALAQTQTQTAAPESAVAAPDKAPATATGKQTTAEQNEILQKLQDLQKQVDTLKEQGRTREKLTITAEEKAAAGKSRFDGGGTGVHPDAEGENRTGVQPALRVYFLQRDRRRHEHRAPLQPYGPQRHWHSVRPAQQRHRQHQHSLCLCL